MSEFVDCRTCKTDCVRADGNYGYTFCDKYTHPPMTNADRIRSMSDKELVRIRYRGAPHCKSDDPMKCNRHDFLDGMSPCELCYYEWLQQPAEEADHEN